jgi:hypothetical protein
MDEKTPATSAVGDVITPNNGDEPSSEQSVKDLVPTEDAQRGVQDIEAAALTWTKPYLIAVFIL